jgi:hypothetical protein
MREINIALRDIVTYTRSRLCNIRLRLKRRKTWGFTMKEKVCESCGYVGKPAHDEYSSLILDALAWMISFVLASITGIIPLVVLGPMFSVWHFVTFRSHRCPKCGNWDMHRQHNEQHHH